MRLLWLLVFLSFFFWQNVLADNSHPRKRKQQKIARRTLANHKHKKKLPSKSFKAKPRIKSQNKATKVATVTEQTQTSLSRTLRPAMDFVTKKIYEHGVPIDRTIFEQAANIKLDTCNWVRQYDNTAVFYSLRDTLYLVYSIPRYDYERGSETDSFLVFKCVDVRHLEPIISVKTKEKPADSVSTVATKPNEKSMSDKALNVWILIGLVFGFVALWLGPILLLRSKKGKSAPKVQQSTEEQVPVVWEHQDKVEEFSLIYKYRMNISLSELHEELHNRNISIPSNAEVNKLLLAINEKLKKDQKSEQDSKANITSTQNDTLVSITDLFEDNVELFAIIYKHRMKIGLSELETELTKRGIIVGSQADRMRLFVAINERLQNVPKSTVDSVNKDVSANKAGVSQVPQSGPTPTSSTNSTKEPTNPPPPTQHRYYFEPAGGRVLWPQGGNVSPQSNTHFFCLEWRGKETKAKVLLTLGELNTTNEVRIFDFCINRFGSLKDYLAAEGFGNSQVTQLEPGEATLQNGQWVLTKPVKARFS